MPQEDLPAQDSTAWVVRRYSMLVHQVAIATFRMAAVGFPLGFVCGCVCVCMSDPFFGLQGQLVHTLHAMHTVDKHEEDQAANLELRTTLLSLTCLFPRGPPSPPSPPGQNSKLLIGYSTSHGQVGEQVLWGGGGPAQDRR